MNQPLVRYVSLYALFALFTTALWAAAPTISSTSPTTNKLNVSAASDVTITFDQSMDNATLTSSTIKVHGNYRGYYTGAFSYGANSTTFNPDSSFKPGEIITVIVTTGVQNSSNEPMVSPRVFNFTVDAPAGYAKFRTPDNYTAYGTGTGNHYVALADLDKDGDIDIASTISGYAQISVMLNNGNGTFASAVTYPTKDGSSSFDISVADVDGDGDMDLLVANLNAYGLSVFVNNGSGSFSTRNDYAFNFPQSGAQFLVTVDIDGDGDIDVVANDITYNYLHVMKNNGSGVFASTGSDFEFTTKFGALASGDLDKDGDMDIVATCSTASGDSVEYFVNDGTGNLSLQTRFYWISTNGPTSVLVADINSTFGDKQDLVWLNGGSDILTYFKDNGAALSSADNVSVGGYPDQVMAADIDSDNDLDLLVANYNDATFSLLSNTGSGTGTFTQTSYTIPNNPDDLATADIDGDGDMDIVTFNSNATVSVFKNYNGGHVTSITPTNGTINTDSTTNIVVVFDENINSSTLTSSTVKIRGSVSGVHSWTLSSYNSGTYTATFNPTMSFSPGEVVTVSVSTGVQNGNSIALEKGYSSAFVVEAASAGAFGSATNIAAGTQPKSVILTDLNADGYADLVAVNNGSSNVSVRLNNGDGTYGSESLLSTGTNPTSVAAGDVDGDGDVDLVVTVTGANQLARFLNNGSGSFGAATTYTTTTGPTAITLGDIDTDGDLDVVYIANSQGFRQSNDGTGAFSNEWGFSSANGGITLADVENDGDLDVIYTYDNSIFSSVKVDYNSGSGVWNTLFSASNSYTIGYSPTGIIVRDFNGDGYIDVVTAGLTIDGTVSYLQNNLNGTFASKVDYSVATSAEPRGLAAADVDGDGDLDPVVANGAGNTAVVFTNNGSGVFTKDATYSTGSNPYAIASADIDADGDMDIVTANYGSDNISVLKGTTAVGISSVSPTVNAVNISVTSNVVVTFNQAMNASTLNSSTIIVSGSQHGAYAGSYGHSNGVMTFDPTVNFKAGEFITVLVKTGVQNPDGAALSNPYQYTFVAAASAEGTFGNRQDYTLNGNPNKSVTADMNGDGAQDVVAITTQWDNATSQNVARVEVLLNNGSGVLGTSDTTYLGGDSDYPNALAATDVDGDGDMDVVLTTNDYNSGNGGHLDVLLNDGTGHLSAPVKYIGGYSYNAYIGTGDLNRDGYNDIVVVFSDLNRVKTYLNNGSGGFAVSDSISTGLSSPSGIAIADVDGDGDLDILTDNYNDGTVALSKNNGNGTFAAVTTFSAGITFPDGIAVGDLNGDGAADLVISGWDSGQLSVLLNSGTGAFSSSTAYTNNSPSKIKLADMDGDGDLDIITTEASIYKVFIRANNGSGVLSTASLYSTGNYPNDFSIADMDGDGDLDVVVAKDNNSVSVIKNIELVQVNSISPVANALDVDKTSNITATFNVDINSATLVDSTVVVHGSVTGKVAGSISYNSGTKTLTFNPTNDFLAGEDISLTLTTNIKNTNGINLHSSYSRSFTVHAAGAGNFAYKDTIPDLGQDASLYYYYASSLNSGDVTGDGKSDIVSIYSGRLKVLKNNTTTFDSISTVSISNTQSMSMADLDKDGDLDMVQTNYSNNNLTVLINDGNGNFTAQTPVNTGVGTPPTVVLKDVDNDGNIDVIMSGSGSQQVYIFYNDGTGTFSNSNYSWINTGEYTPKDYQCVDVDNDGDNDVVVCYASKVIVAPNTGDRSFGSPVTYTIGDDAKKMTTADVNGDGYIDIIVGNYTGTSFSVMLNSGNGAFGTPFTYSAGFSVQQIATADIDGDGDMDIIFRGYDNNASIDKLSVAYNNGSGSFGNQIGMNIKAGSPTWYYSYSDFVLLDIDNDGDLDIVTHANHYYGSNQYENILLFENAASSSSAPTVAATNVTTSSISGSSAKISWTNGDGLRRLVLLKQGSAVNATPTDNGNFSPSTQFGSGTQLGSGNYAVYGSNDSFVTVTGLLKNTTYHISVFEMNGTPGNERVLTTSAPTGSFTSGQFDGPFDQTPGYALSYDGRWSQTNNSFSLSDSFTLELWVKPAQIGSDMVILDHGSDDMWIGINAAGNFFASVYDDNLGNTVTFTGSTTTAVANQWYHIALTAITGDSARLYVNGALEAKSADVIGTLWTSTDVFYPGGDYNNTSYRGLIDELRLWGCVRTESEIRANMHKTIEGIPTNLRNYWQFNEGTGNSSAELVNNNTMVNYDPLLWATSDAPVGGGVSTTSSVAANTTGSQTIGNVNLNMTDGFNTPTDVVVSEVSVAPNSYPTNFSSSVGNKYFIIDAFPYPDSGSFSATLTLSYGAGVLTDNNAANYILYKRGSSSSGDWTSYGSASSVNTTSGDVIWTNIASFSQAIVVNQNEALPVELVSFSAKAGTGSVELNWKTATEVNNAGFEIERSVVDTKQPKQNNWKKIGSVEGNGTSNAPREYSFVDKSAQKVVRYRLKQIDRDGKHSYSQIVEVSVSAPMVFALEQNYPNPFNPSTTIGFTLQVSGHTTLKVYDVIGREVVTLVNENLEAGVYHQKTFDASKLSSGIYFARLQSGEKTQLKKMMLLK